MRRLLTAGFTLALIMGLALPALAHNFDGSGTCDSWTLELDGTWNASEIFVDEVSVGLEQTIVIPDSSDAETRTFVVRWDKPTDVIVDHELERDLSECDTTTTTSTTTPSSTTTTVDQTTTSTTAPSTTTTTMPTSSTSTSTSTTLPAPSTTVPGLASLTASGECIREGMGQITISVDWTGIDRVDFLLLDPQYGDMILYTFTVADGPVIVKLSDVAALFEVRGYPLEGFSFENANQPDGSLSLYVDIEACEEQASVTTVGPSTSIAISTSETLPFTGPEDTALLIVSGLALLGLGTTLVRSARAE